MKTLLLYLLVFLSILHHQTIILENQLILTFFLYQLLPSLFILCIFIQLLPFPKTKNTNIPLLNMNMTTLFLIIKMILLGIPTSAYLINGLVYKKQINQEQAKRLIYCVCIPSLSFMGMSLPFMSSLRFAITLFIIHILSIFILLLFTKKTCLILTIDIKDNSLQKALLFTIKSMAYILSYLFLIVSIKSLFLLYFPLLTPLIHLLFEFSSGINQFIHGNSAYYLCLICIGFAGFCTHLQVMNGCESIHLKYQEYLFFRILHCILNILLFGTLQFIIEIFHIF